MVGNNINNNINNTSYNQPKSNKKTIILVKEKDENLNEHEHKFHEFNSNKFNLVIVNYNEILNYLLSNSIDEINIKNIEMIILIIPIHYHVINNLSTIVKDIRKSLLPNQQQIFFVLPSEYILQIFLSMKLCNLEDIRIQPFSVFDILDLIAVNKRKERITQAKLQNHMISSYPSLQHEIKDLIEFLKKGIEKNETTLLLLNKDTYQQNYLKSLLKSHDLDMDKLSDDGLLITFLNEDWYLSFDGKDNKRKIVTVNKEKILLKWNNLIDKVINNGKRGLRAFCTTDCFFEYSLVEELIDYECLIHPKLHTSILPLCAYRDEDLIKLSDDQIKKLVLIHHNVWL